MDLNGQPVSGGAQQPSAPISESDEMKVRDGEEDRQLMDEDVVEIDREQRDEELGREMSEWLMRGRGGEPGFAEDVDSEEVEEVKGGGGDDVKVGGGQAGAEGSASGAGSALSTVSVPRATPAPEERVIINPRGASVLICNTHEEAKDRARFEQHRFVSVRHYHEQVQVRCARHWMSREAGSLQGKRCLCDS